MFVIFLNPYIEFSMMFQTFLITFVDANNASSPLLIMEKTSLAVRVEILVKLKIYSFF